MPRRRPLKIKNLDFDIDAIIRHYRHGGSQKTPVQRTLGTISSRLIKGHGIDVEIVGKAVYIVCAKICYEGLEFKGDGTYGSAGAQFFSAIKRVAIMLTQEKCADDTSIQILENKACLNLVCPKRTGKMKPQTKWTRIKQFWMKPRGFYELA